MTSIKFYVRLICVVFTLSLSGCSDQLPTYPVSGKVKFENGRTVIVGLVEFQSVEHSVNARGNIQPDGTFTLTTFEEGDGAVEGLHKCVVIQMVFGENMKGHKPSTVGVVNPKYASYLSSGLEAQITAEGPNNVTLYVRGIEKQPEEGAAHKH